MSNSEPDVMPMDHHHRIVDGLGAVGYYMFTYGRLPRKATKESRSRKDKTKPRLNDVVGDILRSKTSATAEPYCILARTPQRVAGEVRTRGPRAYFDASFLRALIYSTCRAIDSVRNFYALRTRKMQAHT